MFSNLLMIFIGLLVVLLVIGIVVVAIGTRRSSKSARKVEVNTAPIPDASQQNPVTRVDK